MPNRDYDSYIFKRGVSPNTLSVISSKNRIFAYRGEEGSQTQTQVGVLATFDPSESRTVEPIRGIGFGDHIAELVPGVTDPMTISVTRSALYLSNIYQVFGFKAGVDGIVRSLRQHRWPFDVRQEVVFSALAKQHYKTGPGDGTIDPTGNLPNIEVEGNNGGTTEDTYQAILTIYEACWMSDYSVSFASDTALVQETVTLNVSDILSGTDIDYSGDEPYSVLNEGNPRSARLQQISG